MCGANSDKWIKKGLRNIVYFSNCSIETEICRIERNSRTQQTLHHGGLSGMTQ